MSRISRVLLAIAVVLVLAGCSSVPYAQRLSQRQAAYAAAAGAPVRSFRFFGSLWSWEPLGSRQLVVYARPNQAWLLDVGGCTELQSTNAIGLTSFMNQVSVGFDKVITSRRDFPCTITQIRPLDVKRFKLAQEKQREIDAAPRPAAPATE